MIPTLSSQNQFVPRLVSPLVLFVRPGLFDIYYCLFIFQIINSFQFGSLDECHTFSALILHKDEIGLKPAENWMRMRVEEILNAIVEH